MGAYIFSKNTEIGIFAVKRRPVCMSEKINDVCLRKWVNAYGYGWYMCRTEMSIRKAIMAARNIYSPTQFDQCHYFPEKWEYLVSILFLVFTVRLQITYIFHHCGKSLHMSQNGFILFSQAACFCFYSSILFLILCRYLHNSWLSH